MACVKGIKFRLGLKSDDIPQSYPRAKFMEMKLTLSIIQCKNLKDSKVLDARVQRKLTNGEINTRIFIVFANLP